MNHTKLLVRQQTRPLSGSVVIPGDKSISHRTMLFSAIADGRSSVRNWLPAGDTLATHNAVKALGVDVEIQRRTSQGWDLTIEGKGLHGLQPPAEPLDCANAGTCMRLLSGILAGQAFPSVLDGSDQLRARPMRRIISPLQEMGAQIASDDGHAPLRFSPAHMRGVDYVMKVASAQVKSAILLAALYAEGDTRVIRPGPTRDHTERLLAAMGARIRVEEECVILSPGDSLSPLDLTIPGDISSAAFPLVAATVVPGSQMTLANVGFNNTRTGLIDMLNAMGADCRVVNQRLTGGEPASDLMIRSSQLHGADIAGSLVVRGIDELPIMAVAATQAIGATSIRDAAELRVKEVDRINVLTRELGKMGASLVEFPDGFALNGPIQLHGAEVDSHGDHRIGMALAVAGMGAKGQTLIHNAGCINDSFPGFTETMRAIGANMEWVVK